MIVENKGCVGVIGNQVALMIHRSRLTPDEAMNLAAWLIVMARIQDGGLLPIDDYVSAVENT